LKFDEIETKSLLKT